MYLDLQGGSLTGSHKSVLTADLGSSTGTSQSCLVVLECSVVTGFHQESRTLKQKPSVICLRSHIPVLQYCVGPTGQPCSLQERTVLESD